MALLTLLMDFFIFGVTIYTDNTFKENISYSILF